MDKEAIARIIDPKGWEYHDDHLRRAEKWEAEGKPADHALVGGYRNGAAYNVAESLAKATAILALQSSERGEGDTVAFVQKWMMSGDHEADQWHRDFAAAIDARATLSPAEPSPESREGIIEECAKVAEAFAARVLLAGTHPQPLRIDTNEGWRRVADGAKDIADTIRALSAPAHD